MFTICPKPYKAKDVVLHIFGVNLLIVNVLIIDLSKAYIIYLRGWDGEGLKGSSLATT